MDTFLLLREPTEKYQAQGQGQVKVLERLLHVIWSEQLFRKTLQIDGQDLVISSPGWWNLEAGPDFRNAELFIAGRRICGDVEIHLHSSDWYHHQHHRDRRYDDVILHVVLYQSQEQCRKSNGEIVPELEMKNYLLEELRLLQEKLPIHKFPFGPETNVRLCRRFMEERDQDSIERVLDSAGDLRMRRKKEQFMERMRATNFQQAFYEGMMEGMGYKQSRYAFRELARRVPIQELLEYDLVGRKGIDAMSAILLGTAGLLQDLSSVRLEPSDRETASYVEQLFSYWKKYAPRFESRKLVGFCWYPSSTRPANFPARRLTAVAAFFHYHQGKARDSLLNPCGLQNLLVQPLASGISGKKEIRNALKKWMDLFAKPLHIYWSYHFQFDQHKFIAPRRLIGKERGRILIVNVVLPGLLAQADLQADKSLEEIADALYRGHPRLTDNSITRLMKHRLFGEQDMVKRYITCARRQQALHHFFYDFCDNRETSCSRCELRNEHAEEE